MRAFDDTERLRMFCERLQHGAERGSMRDDIRVGLRIIGFERRVTIAFVAEEDRIASRSCHCSTAIGIGSAISSP